MSNTIKLRRGLKANLPTLAQGEPAFTTDTNELYVGNGTSNNKIIGESDLDFIDGRGSVATDANSCGDVGKMTTHRSAVTTINTPYSNGLTGATSSAVIVTYLSSSQYGIQMYYVSGSSRMFIRNFASATWGSWIESSTGYIPSLTYSELATRISNATLTPGKQYYLTDYATKYQQPSTLTIKTMATETLVLTAISTTKFSPIVQSLTYPEDIIYYNFNLNLCEDGTTSRNGFITRRIDTINLLDAPQDWRTMLWVRYVANQTQYLKGTTLTTYSTWTSGYAALDVIYKSGNVLYMAKTAFTLPTSSTDSIVFYPIYDNITSGMLLADTPVGHDGTNVLYLQATSSYVEYNTFGTGCTNITVDYTNYHNNGSSTNDLLHNNVFFNDCNDNHLGKRCYNNTFAAGCDYMDFGSACYGNSVFYNSDGINLGTLCHGNVFAGVCSANDFAANCYKNVLNGYSRFNTFGPNSYSNYLATCSYSNTFGSNCHDNILGASSFYNTFGSQCYNNLGGEYTSYNTFGSNCHDNAFASRCNHNTFGSSCYSNTFGSNCDSNHFGSYCNSNTFGTTCSYNTFGNNCYSNTLGDNSYSNTVGNEFYLNTTGISFNYNSFGNKCYNNTIGASCNRNVIGNNCNGMTFGDSCCSNTFGAWCYSNSLGTGSSYNTFGSFSKSNTFGTSCSNNTFGSSCSSNTFGASCSDNFFATDCSSNTFGDSSTSNYFGSSCTGNNITTASNNTFGSYCRNNTATTGFSNNTLASQIYSNTFGASCNMLFIKALISKDLSAVSALKSRTYTTTIEKNAGATYVYWSLSSSNVPTYTTIA